MAVNISQVTLPGIQAEAARTYDVMYEGIKNQLGDVMELGAPADGLYAVRGYFESAGAPERTDRGQAPSDDVIDSRSYVTYIDDWSKEVQFHVNDLKDDRLNYILRRAQDVGRKYALIAEKVFFQILRGASDPKLLLSIPNSPDGAAIYSATDGAGNDRFNFSGGNILSGQTFSTAAGVRNQYMQVLEVFGQFQDTKGDPLFDKSVIDQGLKLFYPWTRNQEVQEAFKLARTVLTAGDGASSNIILDGGFPISLVPTQYLSADEFYWFLKGSPVKPVFELKREDMSMVHITREQSLEAARTGFESLIFKARLGYGSNLPFGTIKTTT